MEENNQPNLGEKPEDDESILELTNQVTHASGGAEASPGLEDAPGESSVEVEGGSEIEDDPLAATAELDEGFDDDDFVDSLGMEIGGEEPEDEEDEYSAEPGEAAGDLADAALGQGVDISGEQLDAALERVIKNMFYDKIDGVLEEVIEKTVTKEIERLKSILLEEASGDEK